MMKLSKLKKKGMPSKAEPEMEMDEMELVSESGEEGAEEPALEGEEMAAEDMELPEMESEMSGELDAISDEDLLAELKKRGLTAELEASDIEEEMA